MNDAITSPQSETAVRSRDRRLSLRSRGFAEYCTRLDDQKSTTISQAGAAWLKHLKTRRRRPIKISSTKTFESYLSRWINPLLGHLEVCDVGVVVLRDFIRQLDEAGLSAKMQNELASCVKSIVASVTTEEGEPRYPRVWSNERLDLPIVENQKQPVVTAKELEAAIQASDESLGVLLALLASSGLRIGEAMALHIEPSEKHSHWNRSDSSLVIRTSVWRGREQNDVKTVAGRRVVEIARPINDLLTDFVGSRTDGYLFGNGKPPHYSALHGKLEEVLPSKGFHSARRFRATVLRAARCPEDIIRFWMGHSGGSITDHYSKLGLDTGARREWCDVVGLGFSIERRHS